MLYYPAVLPRSRERLARKRMKIKILLLFLLIPLTGYANLGDSRVEAISRYGPEVAIKYLPGLFAYTGNKRYAILQFYDSESERAIAVAYIKRENAPLGEVVPFTQEEWHELQQLNLPTAEFPAEPSTTEPSRLSSKVSAQILDQYRC